MTGPEHYDSINGDVYTVHGGNGAITRQPAQRRTRELAIMACVFCKDALFQAWMLDLARASAENAGRDTVEGVFNEVAAKAFILSLCGIESRNDLDTNPTAAALFHERVRLPFLKWKEERDAHA